MVEILQNFVDFSEYMNFILAIYVPEKELCILLNFELNIVQSLTSMIF